MQNRASNTPLRDLQFPELEALRQKLQLSRAVVCRMSGINESTYARWIKYAGGGPGGNCPQASKLNQVRRVISDELMRRPEVAVEVIDQQFARQ